MTKTHASRSTILPPWSLAVAAMLSVQLSAAWSVGLIAEVGAAGTAWLRLTAGAVIFVALARPPLRDIRRRDLPVMLGLGVASGLMGVMFLAAIERIPLGTCVAIEFLGPLTVAAVRSHSRQALIWPVLALMGVLLLTEPWQGAIDPVGVGFAVVAAAGWGAYIVLTQRVGDRFDGIRGLALTVPIAALTTAVVGVPQAVGHLSVGVVAASIGLAVLFPVLPFALEMAALRRMTHAAFGTLMALEPAFGVLIGLLVLGQQPSILQATGILCVVGAGAGAQRIGRRRRDSAADLPETLPYPPQ
jgi:inner membrane transporter RhtA